MLKNVNVDYAQRTGDNRPQGYWYKVKGVDEFDVVLLDTVAALPGKFEGLAGAVTYGMYVDGRLVALGNCTGMSDRMRWSMTHEFQSKWFGKVMRVIAQKQDENSGALIEPRFADDRPRIDKLPEECVWAR